LSKRFGHAKRDNVGGQPGRLLIMVWAVLFCALVFAFLAWRLQAGGLTAFDGAITGWIRADISPGRTIWMILFTDLGNFDFVAVLSALAVILLFVYRKWGEGLGVAAAPLISWPLYTYLKLVFQRPRPDLPHLAPAGGYSFPSGHALTTAALFFTLAIVTCRHIGAPANVCRGPGGKALVWVAMVLLVLLVGISRVYLGVHYPSDVVAGWALGAVVALVIAMLLPPGSKTG